MLFVEKIYKIKKSVKKHLKYEDLKKEKFD